MGSPSIVTSALPQEFPCALFPVPSSCVYCTLCNVLLRVSPRGTQPVHFPMSFRWVPSEVPPYSLRVPDTPAPWYSRSFIVRSLTHFLRSAPYSFLVRSPCFFFSFSMRSAWVLCVVCYTEPHVIPHGFPLSFLLCYP